MQASYDAFSNQSQGKVSSGSKSARGYIPFYVILPISVLLVGLSLLFFVSQAAWAFYDSGISEKDSPPANDVQAQGDSEGSALASLFTKEVLAWEGQILTWSELWDVDPNLIATVMQIESCGNPQALSPAGAIGLFQVMPYHFQDDENPYKPRVNARRGIGYLKQALIAGNGDIRLAFAGYNGGIHGAQRPEIEWSDETRRFVYWGVGIYTDALAQKRHSERLDEWLANGGASLCRAAAVQLGLEP